MFEGLIGKIKTDRKLKLIILLAVVGFAGALVTSYYTFFSPAPAKEQKTALPVAVKAVPRKDNVSAAKSPARDNKTTDNRTDNKADDKTARQLKTDNRTSAAPAVTSAIAPKVYHYSSAARRDPFVPLIVVKAAEKKKGATPLEDNDISDMKLIAIMWSKAGFYALVTLPDGKSYTLREGMKMGQNDGKAYKITKDSVIIKEYLRDLRGVLKPKDTTLKLRGGEE